MRVNKILVPTDFSENSQVAFERAHELASQLGAKLYVLHIQDGSALRVAIKEGLISSESTDEQLEESVRELTLQRFSSMLAGRNRVDPPIECISRRGIPKSGIVHYAEEIK